MELRFKEVDMLNGVMRLLVRVCGLNSRIIFTELGDLAISIEYEYRQYDYVEEIFVLNLQKRLGKHIQHYYHEWNGDCPCDGDICRLVIKLKF